MKPELEYENTVLTRFQNIQRQRTRLMLKDMTARQRDFLDFIPLLFHFNDPSLPGYVENSPHGFPDYSPSHSTKIIASSLAPGFVYKQKAHYSFPLDGLYLIGSVGTIAQTTDSDLDFWLCHNPSLSAEDLKRLQLKIDQVEKVADSLGLEVHFFLMNPQIFTEGHSLVLSEESSGSTQHYLLLEEFYRSGIQVCGRPILWWLIPAGHEHEYPIYLHKLYKKGLDKKEFIDFGGLDRIPPEEFVGAAIWQLYKALNSPYKAILKILLMEAYSYEFPDIHWLSLIAKAKLHDLSHEPQMHDAYIMMYEKIESYLTKRNELERLDLARQCFYLKIDRPVSKNDRSHNWKRQRLASMVKKWHWPDEKIEDLDQHHHWKYERVMQQREAVVQELVRSYDNLSHFAKKNDIKHQINAEELHILGVKLKVALEMRKHKIGRVNLGLTEDISESSLKVSVKAIKNGQRWTLSRAYNREAESIYRSKSVVELLAWAHCNGILAKHSQILFTPGDIAFSPREFEKILKTIRDHLPETLVNKASYSDLKQSKKAVFSMAFVNTGINTHLLGKGLSIIDKIKRIDYLVINSWNEVEVFSYSKPESLFNFFSQYLKYHLPAESVKTNLVVIGYGPYEAKETAARFSVICQEIKQAFLDSHQDKSTRFAITLGDMYALFQKKGKNYPFEVFNKASALIRSLRKPLSTFTTTGFEKKSLGGNVIPLIFNANKADVIQLFWQINNEAMTFYWLDENGAFYYRGIKTSNIEKSIQQQKKFLQSHLHRLQYKKPDIKTSIEYYQIKLENNNWKLLDQPGGVNNYSKDITDMVLATRDTLPSEGGQFGLYCGAERFNSNDNIEAFFEDIAKWVVKKKVKPGQDKMLIQEIFKDFPMIESISLVKIPGFAEWKTYELIEFKNRVEKEISRKIRQIHI